VHLLAEVGARPRADPANGDAAALTKVDLVEVGAEDLVLGIPPLDQRGQPRLGQLAGHRAVGAEQAQLDQLLGDGAGPLAHPARARVAPERARQREEVHSTMLEEAVVLDGQHGVGELPGHLGQAHRPVRLAGLVDRAREHLRLQRDLVDGAPVGGDAIDAIAREREPHLLGAPIRVGSAQLDVPGATRAAVGAGGQGAARVLPARVLIVEPLEGGGQPDPLDVDPRRQRLAGRVDEGGPPRVDPREPGELQAGIDEQGGHGQDEGAQRAGGDDPSRPRRRQPAAQRPR
jgi:hypothetical protein